MEQHGPTWSQSNTRREPKAAKMEPKAFKLCFYVENHLKVMEKGKQNSIPEKWRNNDGQERQNVVISFDITKYKLLVISGFHEKSN